MQSTRAAQGVRMPMPHAARRNGRASRSLSGHWMSKRDTTRNGNSESSGTNLRHCKRQNPCRQCQQKQTHLIPSEKLIHTHALRFHIYVIRGAVLPGGEGAGVKQQKTGRLSLRGWFGRMLRQPPRGFYGQPSVYLSGGVMEIEHFRRVRTYEEGRLCLEFAGGLFTVYGDGLRIETLAAHRITLRGRFLRTEFSSN